MTRRDSVASVNTRGDSRCILNNSQPVSFNLSSSPFFPPENFNTADFSSTQKKVLGSLPAGVAMIHVWVFSHSLKPSGPLEKDALSLCVP